MLTSSSFKLPPGRVVSLDCESDGFNPFLGNRLFGWAWMTEDGDYGWFEKSTRSLKWLQTLLNQKHRTVILQNGKFDWKMFAFEGIHLSQIKANYEDTLVLAKVLNSTRLNNDLASLSREYLGRSAEDKTDVVDWIKSNSRHFKREYSRKPNFSDAPRPLVIKRAIWDVESTLLLYGVLKPQVEKICPQLYQTELYLMRLCVEMELRGIRIDRTRALRLFKDAQAGIRRIQSDLDSKLCHLTIDGIETPQFNVNSTKKHLPAAFKKLGIELRYKTKPKRNKRTGNMAGGGNWSFDEYAMIRYVSKPLQSVIRESGEEGWSTNKFYEEIYRVVKAYKLPDKELLPPLVLKLRELKKMCSTYYEHLINDTVGNYTKNGNEYGIIHCQFNPTQAMTGRFSCQEPNLQNMPRLLGPRECFVPRPGYKFFHFDYSQVEMRMFVHFSRDQNMASAIDKDIHLYVATKVYRKPENEITKEQRKRAKSTGFGILYGSGAEKQSETLTSKGLPTTVVEATKIVNAYHREFPSVRRLTKQLKEELQVKGYIQNPFGRRYYIPTKFGYKALNYECQGTSADIIKRAMVLVDKFLKTRKLLSKILIQVHDELVIEVPKHEEYIIPFVVELMQDLTNYFVPVTVDVEVTSTRWSEKKKYSWKSQ